MYIYTRVYTLWKLRGGVALLRMTWVVSCPAAPPTYGKVRLVTIDAFLGPSAPKWGWPIRVERNDVITLFDGGTMDSRWALTS